MQSKNKKKTTFLFGIAIIITGVLIMLTVGLYFNRTRDSRVLEFFVCEGNPANTEEIKEKGRLLFTDTDIKRVDWENHAITFNKEFLENRPDNFSPRYDIASFGGGTEVLGVSYNMFFAMVLDGEIIFTGTFNQPIFSSKLTKDILIRDIEEDTICFYSGIPADEIEDERLYEYYKNKKLLK